MNGNGHANGQANGHSKDDRPHPQVTFAESSIDPASFFGKLRKLYSEQVLKTQLGQLRHQGSYDAFKLEWHPAYEVRRLHGAKTRVSSTIVLLGLADLRRRMVFPQVCSGSLMLESGMSIPFFRCDDKLKEQDRGSLLLPRFA
jgi:hypothetical protein